MNDDPSFSVVVPCHDSASTIQEALLSVLTQSRQDFEVIVVDDGSRDRSAAIVEQLAREDGRIRLIRQANAGVSAARNAGMAQARGRFIALLDADDLWAPHFLETHAARFERDPRLGLSFSTVRFLEPDGKVSAEKSFPKLHGLSASEILCANPCTTCSTMVMRREVAASAGDFDRELHRAEDQEWLFRVAICGWKIEGVDEPLVFYRNSPDGLSSNLDAVYRDFETMLRRARRSAPRLVDAKAPLAAARMARYLARRALQQGRRTTAQRFLRQSLRRAPNFLLHEPRQTWATFAAAYLPGFNFVFQRLRRLRGLR